MGKNVFVGPLAVLRADEPDSSIIIGDNCNIQDRVVLHSLEDSLVLIEESTSLAHGCIIHGPCKIGNNCLFASNTRILDDDGHKIYGSGSKYSPLSSWICCGLCRLSR